MVLMVATINSLPIGINLLLDTIEVCKSIICEIHIVDLDYRVI